MRYAGITAIIILSITQNVFSAGSTDLCKISYSVDTLFGINFYTSLMEDFQENKIAIDETDKSLSLASGPRLEINCENDFFIISPAGKSIRKYSSTGKFVWRRKLRNSFSTTVIDTALFLFIDDTLGKINLKNGLQEKEVVFNLDLKIPTGKFIDKYLIMSEFFNKNGMVYVYDIKIGKFLSFSGKSYRHDKHGDDNLQKRLLFALTIDKKYILVGENPAMAICYFFTTKFERREDKVYVLMEKKDHNVLEIEKLYKYNPFVQQPGENKEFIFNQTDIYFLSRTNFDTVVYICKLKIIN